MTIGKFVTITLVASLAAAGARLGAQGQTLDEEQQVGQEMFNELRQKGEIVASSPLYDQFAPIASAITRTAQPYYNHPFKFYLVHEPQPNAFSVPGGNVYVTDSLMSEGCQRGLSPLTIALPRKAAPAMHHQ